MYCPYKVILKFYLLLDKELTNRAEIYEFKTYKVQSHPSLVIILGNFMSQSACLISTWVCSYLPS